MTGAAGKAAFHKTFNVALPDPYVTATATNDAKLDTSEFSPCVVANIATTGVLQFAPGFVGHELDPDGLVPVTVARTGGASGTVTVPYATSSNEATRGVDYENVSGTLTFLDGAVAKTLDVPVYPDTDVNEGVEEVDLTLSSPTGGATIGPRGTALLLILDTSPANPTAFVSDASVVEGPNGPTRKLQFVISVPSTARRSPFTTARCRGPRPRTSTTTASRASRPSSSASSRRPSRCRCMATASGSVRSTTPTPSVRRRCA